MQESKEEYMHTEDLWDIRKLLGRHQVLITLLVHLPVPEGTFQLSDMDETSRAAESKSQVLHVICPHNQAALSASPQDFLIFLKADWERSYVNFRGCWHDDICRNEIDVEGYISDY